MRYGARRKTNLPSRPMSSKRSNDTVGAFRSDGRVCRALDLARLRRIPDVGVAGTCQSPPPHGQAGADPRSPWRQRRRAVGWSMHGTNLPAEFDAIRERLQYREILTILAEQGTNTDKLTYPWLIHVRSEEHTSELQSLMRISYAVFC